MKVFFDTNVYVAEALLGDAAARMLEATGKASWRIFSSSHVLAEIERVIVERLGFSRRFAILTRRRVRRRATCSRIAGCWPDRFLNCSTGHPAWVPTSDAPGLPEVT